MLYYLVILFLIIIYLIIKDIYYYRKSNVALFIIRKHLSRRYSDILIAIIFLILYLLKP